MRHLRPFCCWSGLTMCSYSHGQRGGFHRVWLNMCVICEGSHDWDWARLRCMIHVTHPDEVLKRR